MQSHSEGYSYCLHFVDKLWLERLKKLAPGDTASPASLDPGFIFQPPTILPPCCVLHGINIFINIRSMKGRWMVL